MSKPHIFLSVLCGGGKSYEANIASRDGLKDLCAREKVSLTISLNAGTGVDRARNVETAKFLTCPHVPTVFMQLDNDIVFNPSWVLDMAFSDLPIIGGAYPRKQIDWENVKKAADKGIEAKDLPKYSTSFIYNTHTGAGVVQEIGGHPCTFMEVSEIGTGFLAVKRHVIEEYIAAYGSEIAYITNYEPHGQVHHMVFACQRDPRCKVERAKQELLRVASEGGDPRAAASGYKAAVEEGVEALGSYQTEDYAFCNKAKDIGYSTFVYMEANVGHLGYHLYEGSISAGMQVEEVEKSNASS